MRALFTARGCLSLWAIFLSLILLSPAIQSLLAEMEQAPIEAMMQEWRNAVNELVPQILTTIFTTINLPEPITFPGGTLTLSSALFYGFLGLIIIIGGFWGVRRAIKSKAFADDLLSLFGFYLALQVGVGVWAAVFPNVVPLQAGTIALVMGVWILYSMLKAKGLEDSKVFFRSMFLLFLIGFVFFTGPTLALVVGFLQ